MPPPDSSPMVGCSWGYWLKDKLWWLAITGFVLLWLGGGSKGTPSMAVRGFLDARPGNLPMFSPIIWFLRTVRPFADAWVGISMWWFVAPAVDPWLAEVTIELVAVCYGCYCSLLRCYWWDLALLWWFRLVEFEVAMLDDAPTTYYGPFEDWFRAFRSTLRPLCDELFRCVVTTPVIFFEDWLF